MREIGGVGWGTTEEAIEIRGRGRRGTVGRRSCVVALIEVKWNVR